MTLRDIFVFLFKWKGTILGVLVTVTAGVAALAYLMPPSYQATSTVLIERSGAGASPVTYLPNQSMTEVLNTEAAIIKSTPVLNAVVDELRPHEKLVKAPGFVDGVRDWLIGVGLLDGLSARARWVENFERQIKVKPGVQSNILTISFSQEDPVWAQNVVNSVTQNYIRHHSNIFSSRGLSDFYDKRLSEVQDSLVHLRSNLSSMKSGAEPENQQSLYQNVTELRAELTRRRGELLDLQARFAPGHERIQAARAKVADIETAIQNATAVLGRAEKATPGIAQLAAMIANEEQTLRNVKLEYDNAVLAERSESNFADVRLVAPAELPQKPSISRLLLILIGFACGMILALLIAIIREYFDQRTADLEEIETILGLPSLGAVFDLGRAVRTVDA